MIKGVLELHSDAALQPDDLRLVDDLRRIYRNMYTLLEYSDRDALTGLLNRKSLDDAFYSAVLEDLDGSTGSAPASVVQGRSDVIVYPSTIGLARPVWTTMH
jgi:GGDEF domain-containing protein